MTRIAAKTMFGKLFNCRAHTMVLQCGKDKSVLQWEVTGDFAVHEDLSNVGKHITHVESKEALAAEFADPGTGSSKCAMSSFIRFVMTS